jgi:phospholipid-transporting ATPase
VDEVHSSWCVFHGSDFLLHSRSTLCSAAIPGSFVFAMVFMPIYALVTPEIGFSTEYRGLVPRLWGNSVFYFSLLLVPIVCLARDYVWK